MPFTRTRIWRHGITELLNAPTTHEPVPTARGTLPGFEAPTTTRDAAATRVLPIEQLFPGMSALDARAHQAPATHAQQTQAVRDAQRTSRMFVLRARHWHALKVTFAAVLVMLVIYVALLPPEPGTLQPAQPENAAQAAQLRAPTPNRAPAVRLPGPPENAPHHAMSAPPGLERAAVNALIAGDYTLARSLYAQLASGPPHLRLTVKPRVSWLREPR